MPTKQTAEGKKPGCICKLGQHNTVKESQHQTPDIRYLKNINTYRQNTDMTNWCESHLTWMFISLELLLLSSFSGSAFGWYLLS